jgi:hypothetical protein
MIDATWAGINGNRKSRIGLIWYIALINNRSAIMDNNTRKNAHYGPFVRRSNTRKENTATTGYVTEA